MVNEQGVSVGLIVQVGQSFAAGLDSAMGSCISGLPQGSSPSQCCGVVKQVWCQVSPGLQNACMLQIDPVPG